MGCHGRLLRRGHCGCGGSWSWSCQGRRLSRSCGGEGWLLGRSCAGGGGGGCGCQLPIFFYLVENGAIPLMLPSAQRRLQLAGQLSICGLLLLPAHWTGQVCVRECGRGGWGGGGGVGSKSSQME
jgi:hypothetical protein